MLKLIRSLLGEKPSPRPTTPPQASTPSAAPSVSIETYFRDELERSAYIREDRREIVLDHLLGHRDILDTANVLSAQEKKRFGFNARLKITAELADVLNETGIALAYPAAAIGAMWNAATLKKKLHDDLVKMRSAKVKTFKVLSCGDGRDCEWCKSMQGVQHPASFDLESEMVAKCRCEPYCKCVVIAGPPDFDSL